MEVYIIKNKLKQYFNDVLLQKLLKDSSKLLGGNIIEAGLGILAVVIAARGLGPEKYGLLVLVQTYVIIIDQLINFQSWQALIKYGADLLEADSTNSFKRLIKFGTSLDAGTALLGTAVAIGGIWTLEPWLQWSEQFSYMLAVYCTYVLFNLTGTPTAVLRLFDRFDLLALQRVAGGLIKLGAVTIAFYFSATLWGYLIAWIVAGVSRHCLLLALGWRELRRREYRGILGVSLDGLTTEFPGLWSYVWTTNLNGTVKMTSRRFDTVIVGGILGPAAVGLYEIAKKFAKGLGELSSPLYQAIYPELAKLWSQDRQSEFVRLMVRSGILAGGGAFLFWIAIAFLGTEILNITVGSDYVEAYPILVWYILAVVVEIAGFPLSPGMLAMGEPRKSFVIHSLSTLVYFLVLVVLLYTHGLPGSGIAFLVYYIVWTVAMIASEYWMLRGINQKVV